VLIGSLLPSLGAAAPPVFSFLEEDVEAFDSIIHRFDHEQGWDNDPIDHEGPIEMIQDLRLGKRSSHDAVWALSPMWLDLGDRQEVIKHRRIMARSPVVWGVKKSKAERWGWTKTPPTTAEMFQKASSGALKGLMMASASHCTSGALEYISMLYAAAGSPDMLKLRHVRDPSIQETVRSWLKSISRSDQSSVWITNDLVHKYDQHDAMINFQAEIIRANRELEAMGQEPLVQIVPREGTMLSQATLGFIPHNRGRENRKKEKFFLKLQRHLISSAVQRKFHMLGWLSGVSPKLNSRVFRPDLGMQASLTYFPLPTSNVIEEALEIYQTKLRKPSLTIFVLDVSGSMKGSRLKSLKEAMHQVLDPRLTKKYLLQPTAEDVTIIITFSKGIRHKWIMRGDDPQKLRSLDKRVSSEVAQGGTYLFSALIEAYEEIQNHPEFLRDHLPAILLLSDGKPSRGDLRMEGCREND
jgi:Ca-activated chloride channel family protein